jgi:hypothetical protein
MRNWLICYTFAWALMCPCFTTAQSNFANRNMEFKEIRVPIGEPIHLAYLPFGEFERLVAGRNYKEISAEIDHPRLRKTYLLDDGMVIYQQFAGGSPNFVIYQSIEEFLRCYDWEHYLSGGGVFSNGSLIYSSFSLKPLAVEKLLATQIWIEIPSLLPDCKLLQAASGELLELSWPHYNCGRWFSSYDDYSLRVRVTSE